MMTENGYPLEWFVESIDAYLTCGICGMVMRSPRATKCGHVFCRQCLHTWIESYGVCPERCGEIEVESLRRAQLIDKQISCLLTSCKYYKAGCKALIQLSEKESHEKKCRYVKKLVLKSRSFSFFNIGSSSLSQPEPSLHPSHHHRSKSHRSKRRAFASDSDSERDKVSTIHHHPVGLNQQLHKRSKSLGFGSSSKITGLKKRSPSCATVHTPRIAKPMKMQSQHTFRLKRTKPKESLGLVLVSGEKTADGRPESFYVKKVNPNTLAWSAGIQAGDRIVQVDFYNLTAIHPQEAVARIKDKTLVTLTILRGLVPPSKQGTHASDHIYDEILYADQQLSQNLSQQEDGFPQFMATGLLRDPSFASHRHRAAAMNEDDSLRLHAQALNRRPSSPLATVKEFQQQQHQMESTPMTTGQSTLPGEKGSKDSGLSSGSSNSPEHKDKGFKCQDGVVYPEDAPFERLANLRQSYRTEREMVKNFLKTKKKEGTQLEVAETDSKRNCRIEGEYEVEEIYLEKSGTSQLGVTLGYDTKTAKGRLYVCEILSTGLAYQDGRLKCGDIIRRVNGFEVYDPEEAILLFLEQDQDITLTVARKIKIVTNRLVLSTQPNLPAVEHNYAVLEAKVTENVPLRRVDSCGSLDSHSHKYAQGYNKAKEQELDTELAQKVSGTVSRFKMNEAGYEYMSRTRSSSNPQAQDPPSSQLLIRQGVRSSSRSPPRNPSPLCRSVGHLPQAISPPNTQSHLSDSQSQVSQTRQTNLLSPDCTFRPIAPSESKVRRKTTSNEPIVPNTLPKTHRPSSTTPEQKHKVVTTSTQMGSCECEPKIMSPTSEGVRKVPISFRTLSNELRTCRLPNRCDPATDFTFSRSESLV